MRLDEYYALANAGKELCHHGIKGQAWGVTNGPPYPLNQEGKARHRSFASKKEKFFKSNDEKVKDYEHAKTLNRKILRANTSTLKEKTKNESAKNEVRKARHAYKDARRREKMALKKEQQKLRDEQRKRDLEYKTAKLKAKAETSILKSKARADKFNNSQKEREAKREQLKEMTKNIKSPKEALKERVINSGDKKMLKKYGFLLNNQEYQAAQQRINLVADIKRGKIARTIDTVSNALKKGKEVTETAVNAYNTANAVAKVVAPNSKLASGKRINLNPSTPAAKDPSTILNNLKATMEYRNTFGRDPITGAAVKTKYDPEWWHVDYSKPIKDADGNQKTTKSGEPIFERVKGGTRAVFPWEDD